MARQVGGGLGVGAFVLGFVFAFVALGAGGYAYLRWGHPPVATADTPFPMEAKIVNLPLHARIDREMKTAPFAADESGLETGARIYTRECSVCHGVPGHNSDYAKSMFPSAPQLWVKHRNSAVVGVSDDEPGETYWKVANGIRLSGMPSFDHSLSETEMWQVSLLLKNADQTLSPAVMSVLTEPAGPAVSAVR